ncbi:MAG: hypothetical protein M3440_05065, partial [Chloroflexota bacterium]|nr:hypothetical protein [Chloroflexota bacterium]
IPAYAPITRQGGGSSGTVIQLNTTVTVPIEGNVTAEDDLTLKIVRSVNQGITDGTQQLKRSLGVTT